jgi:hypothetical protein
MSLRRHVRSPLRSGLAVLSLLLLIGAFVTAQASSANAATVDTSAWYVLVNRNSGKALDVYDRSTADGGRITQWTRNDQNQQQWQFVDSGGGFYRLKSRHSGKVLDVYNNSTANGAAVVQWADHNGSNQQWRPADSAGGYVRLIGRNSGKALEVQGASADGANIVQYDDLGGNNQQWRLVQVGSGSTFTNPVAWQDFADGDIIRVGDAYYYSASTMHYSPGAPILRSYNLVDWEYAGHSVPRLDFDSAAYDRARSPVAACPIRAASCRPRTATGTTCRSSTPTPAAGCPRSHRSRGPATGRPCRRSTAAGASTTRGRTFRPTGPWHR